MASKNIAKLVLVGTAFCTPTITVTAYASDLLLDVAVTTGAAAPNDKIHFSTSGALPTIIKLDDRYSMKVRPEILADPGQVRFLIEISDATTKGSWNLETRGVVGRPLRVMRTPDGQRDVEITALEK